jgi:hypothetical protein
MTPGSERAYAKERRGTRDWKVSASCPRSRRRIVRLGREVARRFARTQPAGPPDCQN